MADSDGIIMDNLTKNNNLSLVPALPEIPGTSDASISDSESFLLKSDIDDAASVSGISGKTKRQRRKRNQKQRRALTTISEEVDVSTLETTIKRKASGTPPEAKKHRSAALLVASSQILSVGVADGDTPIDAERKNLFRLEMQKHVLSAAKNNFIPQMRGCTIEEGIIVCKCGNDETLSWFRDQICKLNNIWSGAQLKIVDAPKPILARVWIPGTPQKPEVVQDILAQLNPLLEVRSWRVIRYKDEVDGQTIVFRITKQSFDHLQRSNWGAQSSFLRSFRKLILNS